MRKSRVLLLGLLAQLCLMAPLFAEPVRIFAAASLKGALDEVIAARNLDVVPIYGGSAAMARQVAQGAGADIVFLAHPDWMDWLQEQDLIEPGTRCNALGNTLVLAGSVQRSNKWPKDEAAQIDLLRKGRVASGHLRSVPAGQYTAAFLQRQGWLGDLRLQLIETQNVRVALALVARGEVPFGFVYASDVAAEPNVRAVYTPPEGSYPAIRYPMAMTKTARSAAQDVVTALIEETALFAAHGFNAVAPTEVGGCS